MKPWVISLLLMIILTGCDASPEIERGMTLRSSLLQSSNSQMTVRITADYEEKRNHFAMECIYDPQGNMTFSVLEPDTISGVSGKVESGKGMLTFDDAALFFELMTDEKISPICAPWILMKTLRSGYIASACEEDGLCRLTLNDSYDDDALTLDVWLNDRDQPVYAEILWEGRRILSMEIANFVIM